MATTEHGRIIAAHARTALKPLGFRQQGRSRVWLADRGFWLGVVEFQPSAWSKGAYLNVAAHWLWGPPPHILSFDHIERVGGFAEFTGAEAFARQAADLAMSAAEAARRHEVRFASIAAVAAHLVREEQTLRAEVRGDWGAYNAGVASGLVGDWDATRALLLSVRRDEARAVTDTLLPRLHDPEAFTAAVQRLVDTERAHYKLPPLPQAVGG